MVKGRSPEFLILYFSYASLTIQQKKPILFPNMPVLIKGAFYRK